MANRAPSLLALLGLLGVAGYQNREKIGEILRKQGGIPGTGAGSNTGNFLEEIGSLFGKGGGGSLAEGLQSLIDQFRGAGNTELADSWISKGPNRSVTPDQLADALDPDTVAELERKTGLSRAEIFGRLSRAIPEAVNAMTPEGRLPTKEEANSFI
jgi:uncharacterized protein YidB (DUF937 family)